MTFDAWKISILVSTLNQAVFTLRTCNFMGQVQTKEQWFGFLGNVTFLGDTDNRMRFTFSFLQEDCCPTVIQYLDSEVDQLNASMSCEEKESRPLPASNQHILLDRTEPWSSCHTHVQHLGEGVTATTYNCSLSRSWRSAGPRTLYFAVSRCSPAADAGNGTGINLHYSMRVEGARECQGHSSRAGTPHSTGLHLVAAALALIFAAYHPLYLKDSYKGDLALF